MAQDELVKHSVTRAETEYMNQSGVMRFSIFSMPGTSLMSLPAQLPAYWSTRRDQVLMQAYREGGMTTTALAREADLSVMHVGRLIRPWAAFTAPRTPLRCTACLRAQRTCPLSTHHTFL